MEKSKVKNKAIGKTPKSPKSKITPSKGMVVIESLTDKHMVKGQQYEVTPEMADVLVSGKKAVLCQ